jgi:hypothetical protein
MMTSCHFRVTLGPFRETLASWGKTLGLLGPQKPATHATWHTTASQNLQKHWMMSWCPGRRRGPSKAYVLVERAQPPWVRVYQAASGGTSSFSGAIL